MSSSGFWQPGPLRQTLWHCTRGRKMNGIGIGVGIGGKKSMTACYLPLVTSISAGKKIGEPALTRASGQYLRDFENVLVRQINNDKPVFTGTRKVRNFYLNSATLVTQGVTTAGGTYRVSFYGTGTITFTGAYTGSLVGQGASVRVSKLITLTPGTLTSTVSGSVTNAQLEDVTGQSNQNPGEYVPTTSTSASQYFDYLNPHTVDGNGVVTDSGTRTPITTAKGYLSEPLSTNKCTCYSVPGADQLGSELVTNGGFDTDTGYTKLNTTIDGGKATLTITAGSMAYLYQLGDLTAGKVYRLTISATRISGTGNLTLCNSAGNNILAAPTISASGSSQVFDFVPLTTGTDCGIKRQTASGDYVWEVDSWSIKEICGTNSVTGAAVSGLGPGAKAYHDGTTFQNPIPGMTLSGDTAAVLSIVTDQAAIDAAGLGRLAGGYKFYDLVTGVGGAGNVDMAGAMSAVTTSMSCYARIVSGSAVMSDNAGANSVAISGSSLSRFKVENFTAVAGRLLRITAAASSRVIFAVPQLEELPYATSEMPTNGATATRAATVNSLPTASNMPTSGVRHIQFDWTPLGLATGVTRYLFGSYLDANNEVNISFNGSSAIAINKKVAGVTESTAWNISPVVGTTYRVDAYIYANNKMYIKASTGTAGADGSTTVAPVFGANLEIGSLNSLNQAFATIKNFRIEKRE